jgi:hypothetical protein
VYESRPASHYRQTALSQQHQRDRGISPESLTPSPSGCWGPASPPHAVEAPKPTYWRADAKPPSPPAQLQGVSQASCAADSPPLHLCEQSR